MIDHEHTLRGAEHVRQVVEAEAEDAAARRAAMLADMEAELQLEADRLRFGAYVIPSKQGKRVHRAA